MVQTEKSEIKRTRMVISEVISLHQGIFCLIVRPINFLTSPVGKNLLENTPVDRIR